MKKSVFIVSGYFNPLHKGHIEYFQMAKSKCDKLFVIVNNDFQRELKGSKEFQNENERMFIVENLRIVDKCFLSIDIDRSVIETVKYIYNQFNSQYEFTFANGGDQLNDLVPEKSICDELGIKLIDKLGEKIQSSSWLLKKI